MLSTDELTQKVNLVKNNGATKADTYLTSETIKNLEMEWRNWLEKTYSQFLPANILNYLWGKVAYENYGEPYEVWEKNYVLNRHMLMEAVQSAKDNGYIPLRDDEY